MKRSGWLALGLAGCIENQFVPVGDPNLPGDDEPTATGTAIVPGDCEEPETLSTVVSFPARADCPWGVDGNLWQMNEFNQARVEELQTVALPTGAELCSLRVRSTTEDLLFDDHVTIALGDVVLVGAGSGYSIDELPMADGLHRYDWDALVGTPFAARDAAYWCLGGASSTCVVPSTEQVGPLQIDIGGPAMAQLTAAFEGQDAIPLALVTFGDDDDDDCAHTTLSLEVQVAFSE